MASVLTKAVIDTVKGLRVPRDHALIGLAEKLPFGSSAPVLSLSSVVIPAPSRPVDIQLRVSAPTVGTNLPIILLSHGHGHSNNLSSSNGYGPVVNFWAAHGFVVIQPTHLSSKALDLDASTPGAPFFWRERAQDMSTIIDQLDLIEDGFPGLSGRLDKTRIAVVGHSMGGHTAGLLLGATLIDEEGLLVSMLEPRIKAGVLFGAPGNGGDSLSKFAYGLLAFREPNFAEMKTPTLVVAGDADASEQLTVRGPSWHADPYTFGTGPKSLLTVFGGKHIFGGISGYDSVEAKDEEDVQMVAAMQRLSTAYLKSALFPEDHAWIEAVAALEKIEGLGKVESK